MRDDRHILIPLLVAGAAFVVNRAVLGMALFGFDAYAAILTSRIQSFGDFTGTFTEVLMDGRLWAADFYRPVGNLLLATDWALWGMRSSGYQLTSMLVWCAVIVTAYFLLRRMLGGRAWIGPAVAALVVAMHPSALAILPFPARRTETLMVLFVALSLLALPVARGPRPWSGRLLAGVLAMLAVASKETGVVAVPLVFVHQWLFWGNGRDLRRRGFEAALAALPAAVLCLALLVMRFFVIGGMGGYHNPGKASYLAKLTEFAPQYLTGALASGVLDAPVVRGVVTVLSVAAVAALCALLLRRRDDGGAGVAAATIGAAWAVMAIGLACLSMQFSARYLLPVTFGAALVLGALAEAAAGAIRAPRSAAPRALGCAAAGVVLAAGAAALAGSPLVRSYPQLAEATRVQDELLVGLGRTIASADRREEIDVDLRRRIEVGARALDDVWMIAPWGLAAWLELEYPDHSYHVSTVVRPQTPTAQFWAVIISSSPFPKPPIAAAGDQRPNILIIMSDQHRADAVGYRGHPVVRTPNIDRIAAEGACFTSASCTSPICNPSRMSLMTGRYVHELGVWLNGVKLPEDQITWADRLAASGMQTGSAGKLGVVGTGQTLGFASIDTRARHPVFEPWPFESPFDERLEGFHREARWLDQGPFTREEGIAGLRNGGAVADAPGLRPQRELISYVGYYDQDREATDLTLAFLRRPGRDTPWVHFVGLTMPHWPFICPTQYMDMYDPAQVDLPHDADFDNDALHPAVRFFQQARPFEMDEAKLRRIIAAYDAMITCVDGMIGEILDELDAQGLAGSTYVIYVSDHGEALGDHGLFDKQTSYEGSVAVPLAIRGPGVESGLRIDEPVSLIDLYPTLLDMAGIDPRAEAGDRPGRSWLPRLEGRAPPQQRDVFAEYHGGYFRQDWCMLRRGSLKYTHYDGGPPTLFDLDGDPHEDVDLAGDPAWAGSVAELEEALREIMDPEATSLRAKRDCGLIGPGGEDYTQTLTWQELEEGRRTGRFGPPFKAEMEP